MNPLSKMLPLTDAGLEGERQRWRTALQAWPRGKRDTGDIVGMAMRLSEWGLFQLLVPREFGGATARVVPLSLAVAREELAYEEVGADALFAVQGLSAYAIGVAGQPAAKERWLPALGSGQAIGAFAVTEPDAGSDVAAMRTSARPVKGGYELNGFKTFISNATHADVAVIFARLEDASNSDKMRPQFAAFVVPTASPGVSSSPMDLMAAHAIGTLRLQSVRVDEDQRLQGDGLGLCMQTLQTFRPTVGAAGCGMAARALCEAERRVTKRRQFGAPLVQQQSVAFALADMATALQAARLMAYQAAWAQGGDAALAPLLSSMAKLHATESAGQIVDRALQLCGAAGLVRGGIMESLYREVRALRIYEGTSEIQKLVIAKHWMAQQGDPS